MMSTNLGFQVSEPWALIEIWVDWCYEAFLLFDLNVEKEQVEKKIKQERDVFFVLWALEVHV